MTKEAQREFAEDVKTGLSSQPKRLSPRYFYDAVGSHLFEAICALPWYPLTRGEHALLDRHAAEMLATLEPPLSIVELGCGVGDKVARLATALADRSPGRAEPLDVHLVDVSATALALSSRTLAELPHVRAVPHRATFEQGLALALAARPDEARALVVFLGSNIGNFDADASRAFLSGIRRALRPGDALLVGADLVRPERELLLAYDDPIGVTAAFNKNLLSRINRELGADFELAAFDHRAVWNAERSRVEMHLVSRRSQRVRVPACDLEVDFAAGEHVFTESSHKFTPESVVELGAAAGFARGGQWVEKSARFSTTLFTVEPERASP